MLCENLIILLDASGSMWHQAQEIVKATNTFLDAFALKAKEEGKSVNVTIYKFSDTLKRAAGPILLTDKDPRLTHLKTIGCTALYDSLGSLLRVMQPNTTLVVATDGEDTASAKETAEKVQKLMEGVKRDFQTKFVFLAENESAFSSFREMGVKDDEYVSSFVADASDNLSSLFESPFLLESVSSKSLGLTTQTQKVIKKRQREEEVQQTQNSPEL